MVGGPKGRLSGVRLSLRSVDGRPPAARSTFTETRRGDDDRRNGPHLRPYISALYISSANTTVPFQPRPAVSDEFDVQAFGRDLHELLVLATLRQGAKHGYQIALDVETESNGLVRFRHGTLYPILHRLEGSGLIAGAWSRGESRRRKVYELTARGRSHLSGETHRVEDTVIRLMGVLRGPDGATA